MHLLTVKPKIALYIHHTTVPSPIKECAKESIRPACADPNDLALEGTTTARDLYPGIDQVIEDIETSCIDGASRADIGTDLHVLSGNENQPI